MSGSSNRSNWPIAAAAAIYALAGAIAISLDSPAKGWAILICSVGGVVGVCALAKVTDRTEWLAALSVLVPISIFQVFPDWMLAKIVGSIEFPDNGGLRIDAVIPLAMAGLWVLPLLIVVLVARGSLWRGALASTIVFAATEVAAPHIGVWHPAGDVSELLGIAVYVLPAEAALGAAVVYAVRVAADAGWATKLTAAAAVSIFYSGALAISALLIDNVSI
ncbi:MAG: DUF6989 domain-containing protein [Solirubrobacterales bacterium]